MKKVVVLLVFALLMSIVFGTIGAQAAADDQACWGQATAVFAQSGEMGEHASMQENPRVGLRNLARALYEDDTIPEDTMQALGAFVAAEYELEIDACME